LRFFQGGKTDFKSVKKKSKKKKKEGGPVGGPGAGATKTIIQLAKRKVVVSY